MNWPTKNIAVTRGSVKHKPRGGKNGTKRSVSSTVLWIRWVGRGWTKRKKRYSSAFSSAACSLDRSCCTIEHRALRSQQNYSETSRTPYFPRAVHQSKTKPYRMFSYSCNTCYWSYNTIVLYNTPVNIFFLIFIDNILYIYTPILWILWLQINKKLVWRA